LGGQTQRKSIEKTKKKRNFEKEKRENRLLGPPVANEKRSGVRGCQRVRVGEVLDGEGREGRENLGSGGHGYARKEEKEKRGQRKYKRRPRAWKKRVIDRSDKKIKKKKESKDQIGSVAGSVQSKDYWGYQTKKKGSECFG